MNDCPAAFRCAAWRSAAVLVTAMTVLPVAAADLRVNLTTSDGVALVATYYEPPHRPAPLVLLLHMPTRSRADWDHVAAELVQRGVGALALDFRGHGESAAQSPEQAGPPDHDPSQLLRDVQVALAWLKGRPESLPGRLGVVGASLGANVGLVAAAEDPAVSAVVLLSPTLDFRGVRTGAALKKFGDRPALLIASEEDGYATRSARELATAGSGPRDLRLTTGAGHGTVMLVRQPDLLAAVVDWLCARLL